MFDPSILPPLPPMAKQPPSILPPLPPLPPMSKQPPWVPLSILPPLPPLPPMSKQPPWVPPSILPPLPPMSKQPPWVPLGTKDCSQGFCSIYCPQWCYIVFPPPPPSFFFEDADTDNSNSSGSPTFSPLVITIIGILAAAFLLISYYAIVSKFCRGRRQQQHDQHHRRRDDGLDNNEDEDDAVSLTWSRRRGDEEWHVPPSVGLDEAFIAKITLCKYGRGDGLVGCSDCSVCLSEFREGESLRLLPKCSHAFHVPCIDTWLKSHSNCPLCRANILLASPAEPPQSPAPPPPEADQPEGVRNEERAVARTSLENAYGSDSSTWKEFVDVIIEIGGDESQRMRRSFSMDSFHRGRVSVADILGGEVEDGEVVVVGSSSRRSRGEHSKGSSSLHCDSPVAGAIKRTLSSGRFCLTRQGRRDRRRGRNSLLLPI